jgi:hypothetical protein
VNIWVVAQAYGEQLWRRDSGHAIADLMRLIHARPDGRFIFFSMEVPDEVEKTDEAIQAWVFDGIFDPFE